VKEDLEIRKRIQEMILEKDEDGSGSDSKHEDEDSVDQDDENDDDEIIGKLKGTNNDTYEFPVRFNYIAFRNFITRPL